MCSLEQRTSVCLLSFTGFKPMIGAKMEHRTLFLYISASSTKQLSSYFFLYCLQGAKDKGDKHGETR